MSVSLSSPSPEIREKRLKSIINFNGTAKVLEQKELSGDLREEPCAYTQCGDCQEFCAKTLLNFIQGAAVVCHQPIGCYAPQASNDNIGNASALTRHLGEFSCETICTNIQERDTVYGGAEKLRKAIFEVNKRQKPTAIFIVTSCASGIIGDDIDSVASETEEEIGVPVVAVSCEGFKSKIWTTGFDAAFHGILRRIVKPSANKQHDLVNVFNFQGGDYFSPLLSKLGLRTNYTVPMNTVPQLEKLSEAACSVSMCETLATYIFRILDEKFGVPEIDVVPPYGLDWTDNWLRSVAKFTEKTDIVEDVIRSEHERIMPQLNEYRDYFAGKTVFIMAGDTFAHNLANALTEIGLQVIGVNTLHHDQRTDSDKVNTLQELIKLRGDIQNFSVCNKQPARAVKKIIKLKPDFLVCRHQNLVELGYKLGIPSLLEGDANVSVGYDGLLRLGARLKEAYLTRKFNENIARHAKFPYTSWWMEQ